MVGSLFSMSRLAFLLEMVEDVAKVLVAIDTPTVSSPLFLELLPPARHTVLSIDLPIPEIECDRKRIQHFRRRFHQREYFLLASYSWQQIGEPWVATK